MTIRAHRAGTNRWRRRSVHQLDRRALERAGWRTLLEYRENHVRGGDGRLIGVEISWTAEAERDDGAGLVARATAPSVAAAWARVRDIALAGT